MMPSLYMTVAQLYKLLEYFPPNVGYLRIQVIQSVFSHLTDSENMYFIFDQLLTFDEQNEVRDVCSSSTYSYKGRDN
jgi:hypothetical protein